MSGKKNIHIKDYDKTSAEQNTKNVDWDTGQKTQSTSIDEVREGVKNLFNNIFNQQ